MIRECAAGDSVTQMMIISGGCWCVATAGAGSVAQTQSAARISLQRRGLGNICAGGPRPCPGPWDGHLGAGTTHPGGQCSSLRWWGSLCQVVWIGILCVPHDTSFKLKTRTGSSSADLSARRVASTSDMKIENSSFVHKKNQLFMLHCQQYIDLHWSSYTSCKLFVTYTVASFHWSWYPHSASRCSADGLP